MKRILLLVFLCSVSLWADAQALLGTTGLLHAPTADMQRDKTFLFGGNYLNTHPLSTHFRSSEVGYTFNYYINITIFPWLEVAYICTLVHADHGSTYFPEQSWGKFTNQDRAFSARLRLWKEGWWKEWVKKRHAQFLGCLPRNGPVFRSAHITRKRNHQTKPWLLRTALMGGVKKTGTGKFS